MEWAYWPSPAGLRVLQPRSPRRLWHSVDQPWVHLVDEAKFARLLDKVRQMDHKIILAGHLPPCRGMNEECLKLMAGLPGAEPFVGPNQVDLEAMMAQMTGGGDHPH